MPTAWGICPYEVVTDAAGTYRRCAAEQFRTQIVADAGALSYGEILGDHGLVKVRASAATLNAMNATPGFVAIPRHWSLDDSLADLTTNEKNALTNKLLALGYTAGELQAAFGGNLNTHTLRDLLRFAASRWRRSSSEADWPRRPRPVEHVDAEVG